VCAERFESVGTFVRYVLVAPCLAHPSLSRTLHRVTPQNCGMRAAVGNVLDAGHRPGLL
jgi:hypothetical protein